MMRLYSKNKNKKGFSLAETLIAVALIAVLLALGSAEVIKYSRTLKLKEYDDVAKEIFIAAQNNLASAYNDKYLDRTGFGTQEDSEGGSASDEVYYFTVNPNASESGYDSLSDDSSILGLMLPVGSLDDTVRTSGSYIIRYQRETGTVLDVFYSEPGNGKGTALPKDQYSTLMSVRADKDARLNYGANKKIVGYYGGVSPVSSAPADTISTPKLTVVNAEKLYAIVTPGDPGDMGSALRSINLVVKGETSGASVVIPLKSGAYERPTSYDYLVMLDDITTSGGHFAENTLFAGFIPGENISLKAQVCSVDGEGKTLTTKESATKKTNSLFADLSGGTAVISNIRHLENLGYSLSGFNGNVGETSVSAAKQTTDLSYLTFKAAIGGSSVTIYNKGGAGNGEGNFAPVTPFKTISYDGGGFKVSDITVNDASYAGLFGRLMGGEVKNLSLVDFNINSTGASAGALCGIMEGTNVNSVLAYNDVTSGENDAAFEIKAAQNAGGLIGGMSGGSVIAGAAALYVKADENAGGLIGKASGAAVISSSYAGGHTVNARYQLWLEGAGRINVQGTLSAGGLVGTFEGTDTASSKVMYSYSTASAIAGDSGYGGGLIGKASNVALSDFYAANFVEKKGTAEAVIGNGSGNSTISVSGKNYYVTNLSPRVLNNVSGIEGVSGKDDSKTDFIFVGTAESKRQAAYIYDDSLKVDYGGKYYFPTAAQLGGTATGVTNVHYGDWQVPFLDTLDFTFINEDTLTLHISPAKLDEKLKDHFIFTITGETSDVDIFYLVNATDRTHPVITDQGARGVDASGNETIIWSGAVPNRPSLTVDAEGYYDITLDDITKDGTHFAQIFRGTGLIPGENITARLVIGQSAGINEIWETDAVRSNSLFAYGTKGLSETSLPGSGIDKAAGSGNALIGYARHLANLDPGVSGVDNRIMNAYILNDIEWNPAGTEGSTPYKYNQITGISYEGEGEAKQVAAAGTVLRTGTFYGITNPSLILFDGRENTLSGFDFTIPANTDENSGLFREISGAMNIRDLELLNCIADAHTEGYAYGGSAGMLAGYCDGTSNVIIDTVLVRHDNEHAPAQYGVMGLNAAGGMIGSSDGILNLTNCSASVLVASNGPAGGLIGAANGSLTMDRCYSGGHTASGKFDRTAGLKSNVYSSGSAAGGIAGFVNSVDITRSFSVQSVSAGAEAGGLFGSIAGSASFDTVYSIGPVNGGSVTGAVVGSTASTIVNPEHSVYYLPDIYEKEPAIVGSGDLTYPADEAYYMRNRNAQIAAKDFSNTMQDKTYVFDETLSANVHGSTLEYPFSIWTSFPDKWNGTAEGNFYGVYYGDWEPVVDPATVKHTITFNYIDLYSSETGVTVDLSEEDLGKQNLLERQDNTLLIPDVPYYPGYVVSWTVYDKDGNVLKADVAPENGRLKIDSKYINDTNGNLTATAKYTKSDSGVCNVYFMYDKTGKSSASASYEMIGSPKQVAINSTWKALMDDPEENTDPRTVNNYRFIGWYKDKDCKEPWLDTDEISADCFAYAKYEKLEFYTVTIDFLYEIEGTSGAQAISNIPRYSMEDVPQYRIVQPKGEAYSGSITLPDVNLGDNIPTRILVENIDKDKAHIVKDGKYLQEASVENNTCYVEATDTAHLQVIYTIPATKAKADVAYYRVVYQLGHTDNSGNYSSGTRTRYPSGENTYFPLAIDAEKNPVRPTVEFETIDNFNRVSTQDTYRLDQPRVEQFTDDDGNKRNKIFYDLTIQYERKQFEVYFDTSGGSTIEPVSYYYGQPVSKNGVISGKTTTREGYVNPVWGDFYRKGDTSRTKYSGDTMPAYNLEIKATWTRTNIPYKVIVWRQKVTDDRDAADAQKTYDFVESHSFTVPNLGVKVSLADPDLKKYTQYAGTEVKNDVYTGLDAETDGYKGFHYNDKLSTQDSVEVNADGSTVLNVYYDRNMIYICFDRKYDDVYVPTAADIALYNQGKLTVKDKDDHTLTYDAQGHLWYYTQWEGVVHQEDKGLYLDGVFYVITNQNEPKNQYTERGQELEYKKSGNGWFDPYYWYYKGTKTIFNGTRYTEATGEYYSGTTVYHFENGKMTAYKVPKGNPVSGDILSSKYVLRKVDGKYHRVLEDTINTLVTYYASPSVDTFRGLFGQPISKYGYSWPMGAVQGGNGSTHYYKHYYNGTKSDKKDDNTGMTYLGQFVLPDEFVTYPCVYYDKGSNTSNKIYFIKEKLNENGMVSWPSYTGTIDPKYVSTGNRGTGNFRFSNKFEGFSVYQYTTSSYDTDWETAKLDDEKSGVVAVRFKRNEYPVTVHYCYITPSDGIVVSNEKLSKNKYFETAISTQTFKTGDLKINNTKVFNNSTYTWDGVIYRDDQCTKPIKDSETDYVPSAPLEYFVCYTPPFQTVKFKLTLPSDDTSVKEADLKWKSNTPVPFDVTGLVKVKANDSQTTSTVHALDVLKGFNLDGYVTNNEGTLHSYYTPASIKGDGCQYEFDGWVLERTATKYYSSMPVNSAMTLVPKWKKTVIEDRKQNRIVNIYHKDMDGNIIWRDEATGVDHEVKTVQAGQSATFESKYFDRYYPTQSLQSVYIGFTDNDPATDIIDVTFYYKPVTTWKYQVEYRVRYFSFDTTEGLSFNPDNDGYQLTDIKPVPGEHDTPVYITLGTEVKEAFSQYQSVVFDLPEKYGSYTLDHIDFIKKDYEAGTTRIKETTQTINDNGYAVIDRGVAKYTVSDTDAGGSTEVEAKVIFYVIPDPTALKVGNRYEIYDGDPVEYVETVDTTTYAAPPGYTVTAKSVYSFVTADGTPIAKKNVIDSGVYKMHGFIVLEVKANGAEKPDCYLLYKDVSRTLNIKIAPRPVTIRSATDAKAYDGTALKHSDPDDDITMVGPTVGGKEQEAFVKKQGCDVYFSVDAFRLDKGTQDNSFTVELYDGKTAGKDYTNPANYEITLEYGTLTVN